MYCWTLQSCKHLGESWYPSLTVVLPVPAPTCCHIWLHTTKSTHDGLCGQNMYVSHSRLFLFESFKAFYIRQAVPSSESQAAEVPGGLLEWHFICFFSPIFLLLVRASVYRQMTTCRTTKDSHSLKTPFFLSTAVKGFIYIIPSCFFFFHMESHHRHFTPCAVQALKGKGSRHHSAGLVCKDEATVTICVMSLMVVKQNMSCKYTGVDVERHTVQYTVHSSSGLKIEHTAQLNRRATQMEGLATCCLCLRSN